MRWLGDVLLVVVIGFIGYVVCLSVHRRTIGQMIVLVIILMSIQSTVEGLTPIYNAIMNRINGVGEKWDWPVKGPVSQEYGPDNHGIDIACTEGSPIRSVAEGNVAKVGDMGVYGLAVLIDHGRGLQTLYAHLSKIEVQEGWPVVAGKRIGLSGKTGNSSGPHLHFEVRKNGIALNPREYLR